tara:strand:- start:1330 stop:1533 length:204 start_codon:yes stop_codon:yes gene_type:complete
VNEVSLATSYCGLHVILVGGGVLKELLLAVVDNRNGHQEAEGNSEIGEQDERKACASWGGNAAVSGR